VPLQGTLSMPASISFGTLPAGTPNAVVVVTMSNVGGTPVTVSSVTSSSPVEFGVDANCGVLNPGAQCVFTVTFTPAAVGARAATITVAITNLGNGQADSDFTATLAIRPAAGAIRYVALPGGSGSATVATGEEATLVVANTPKTLYLYDPSNLGANDPANAGLNYQVQLTGATPAN